MAQYGNGMHWKDTAEVNGSQMVSVGHVVLSGGPY